MLKNKKFLFLILFFLVFLLLMSTNSFGAVTTADLDSLTDTQKETILKVWNWTLWYCDEVGINIDNTYYFITYTMSPVEHATVVISNPTGNTERKILNNGCWNWSTISYCRPNEDVNQSDAGWGGYFENPYDVAFSVSNGSNPLVIANNIETSNNEYKTISRSYKDVSFLNVEEDSPTETPQQEGIQLMTPMTVEEIPQLITKLLIILVPVGLTIFGILLLVYLIGSQKWLMH